MLFKVTSTVLRSREVGVVMVMMLVTLVRMLVMLVTLVTMTMKLPKSLPEPLLRPSPGSIFL